MTERELRLRQRIDVLLEERDLARKRAARYETLYLFWTRRYFNILKSRERWKTRAELLKAGKPVS